MGSLAREVTQKPVRQSVLQVTLLDEKSSHEQLKRPPRYESKSFSGPLINPMCRIKGPRAYEARNVMNEDVHLDPYLGSRYPT